MNSRKSSAALSMQAMSRNDSRGSLLLLVLSGLCSSTGTGLGLRLGTGLPDAVALNDLSDLLRCMGIAHAWGVEGGRASTLFERDTKYQSYEERINGKHVQITGREASSV